MFGRRSRRGANAIEFGLTLPVFVGILLGLMDYGWLFANQAGIDNAASLACREGSMVDPVIGNPRTTATDEINTRAAPFCTSGPGCNVVVQDVFAPPDRTLVCSITMNFSPLVGFVPVPGQITSTSYYRLEWQR
ncbi:MAG: pilus assembly protein [Myxococcales bacterium]|nr:pilus assembly protein [Myxococcales bacterium]